MAMIGRLIQTLGRLLTVAGMLGGAFGILLIFVSPPALGARLGGWFLAVGSCAALLAVIPRYVGSRIEALAGRTMPLPQTGQISPDELYAFREHDRASLSAAPDRSGFFGGAYHHDQLVWNAMRNGQE